MTAWLLCAVLLGAGPPPEPATPRSQLLDVSADVLAPSESQIGLFFAEYAHGVFPGFQLSTHLAGDVVTLVNLSAKLRLLNRPELRASVEVGALWAPVATVLLHANVLSIPAALRATAPLGGRFELNLAATYQSWNLNVGTLQLVSQSFGTEADLVRMDDSGAWLLQGRLPLATLRREVVTVEGTRTAFVGVNALADSASWSVMLARDLLFGDSGHVRLGLGYRRTPGILIVESIDHVIVQLGLYWR